MLPLEEGSTVSKQLLECQQVNITGLNPFKDPHFLFGLSTKIELANIPCFRYTGDFALLPRQEPGLAVSCL